MTLPFSRRATAALAAAALLGLLSPGTAHASATVTSYQLVCTSFTASGTSTAPHVTIYAQNEATSDPYWTIVPVVGGAFSGSVSFPQVAPGTTFNIEVWGSLNLYSNLGDSGYYDGEAFLNTSDQASNCAAVPALRPSGVAILAALLGLAGWAAVRRRAAWSRPAAPRRTAAHAGGAEAFSRAPAAAPPRRRQ